MSDSRSLLNKLNLTPDDSGYAVAFGPNSNAAEFQPLANYRRTVLNDSQAINCTWLCEYCEYNYLMAAYRAFVKSGGVPFLIDLVIDGEDLTEHKAVFVLNTMRLQSVQGLLYTVTATLLAEPTRYDTKTRPFVVDGSLVNPKMFASAGLFTIQGQSVEFDLPIRHMQAQTGIFSITGGSVPIRGIQAGTGLFTITVSTVGP